eukprot:CAMPEP_0172317074 /NCGR_PEP_ID=MMETSP1058-20130122/30478_1 /TAXON_ID=83371 /ORGANISM="Detonula confervacea, Strain CCMP 353" /LENGTH=1393 /DNA_ID=CAMNT_0013031535 /DNA_START=1 /DNA_END=4182 /DNA_ORIENTATION=+
MGLFGKEKTADGGGDAETKNVEPMKWREDPETTSNLFSTLTFLWIQPMFERASYLRKHGQWLEQEDLAPLAEMDRSENVETMFEEAYENYVPKKQKSSEEGVGDGGAESPVELERRLVHALIATCKRRIIVGGLFRLVNSCLQFSFPILLNFILSYFQDVQSGVIKKGDPPGVYYRGYWLSALLMAFVGLKAVTESAYFYRMNRCSWRMKTAISSSVYRKSLRLASSAQQQTSVGEIVNLMQVDATKIEMFMLQIHTLWDGLFQIIGYMAILGFLLGWTCLVGLLLIIFAIPIMGKITGKMFGLNHSMVKYTDERVKTANEALQGILCVKMYSWEEPLSKQIDKYREDELTSLRAIAYLRAFFRAYMSALPIFAAAVTFFVYVYATEGKITANILFSSIVAFDMLRMPLMFYPMALAQWAQCKVSLMRVAAFLGYSEVNQKGYTRNIDSDGEIIVENASLYWHDPDKPLPRSALNTSSPLDESASTSGSGRRRSFRKLTSKSSLDTPDDTIEEEEIVYPKPVLSDVNIRVRPGQLCAIVGPVGAGKSSLCASILNEAVLGDNSHITLNGKVAYASQSAWILNKTVRDNILFGSPFDEDRYNRVIDACCLRPDLKILEDGDMTEIGERGINLSGGQKQRISVARVAYSNADVFIFDDPLSALDPEVAEKVFHDCILEMLKGKTRLLVTNQLQCVSRCDSIIALGKKGRVLEQGTYDDLINDSNGEVTRLLRGVAPSKRNLMKKEQQSEEATDGKSVPTKELKKLMTKEERETGNVKLGVYLKYIQAGGGYLLFAGVLLWYILSTATNVASTVWISIWTADSEYQKQTETFYIVGYAISSVLLGVMSFVRSYGLASFGVRSSFQLHGGLLRSVLRAPMSFYDTTPMGRILSRFSKDMHTVDHEIADFLDIFMFIILQLTVVMVTIVVITPYFAIALPFLGFFYIMAMNYFRRVSRETKRLESVARSPVYSQFSETLGGLTTIRAFGKSAAFTSSFDKLLDTNTQTVYCNKAADRWLAIRLEMIAAAVVGLAALFATQAVLSESALVGDTSSFASLAGISLSYAVTSTAMMQYVVRSFAQVEAAMNSVERVVHYAENIPQESPMTSDELENEKPSSPMKAAQKAVASAGGKALHPTKEWPEHGAITLKNLQMRYRAETPLVLKGLNVSFGAGERIGVVGRTGSGKSSLLLVLMRIVEPYLPEDMLEKKYEAPLSIDGVDVMRIGLFDLRTKLGIIPQLPVLFSGTIRSNMDPFNTFSDEEIWSALEKCRMKDAVDKMTDGLQSRVAEYGENLSQGQRQLLCLGRALLKKCKILLLDEATSSVDYETDRAIQTTIREAFKGCTIITIAHRVVTIMDSDKILVVDNGTVGEFGPPQELLANKNSLFSEIVSHSSSGDD